MRGAKTFMLLVALAMMIDMAWAQGLGGSGLCTARNAAEVYCVNHGGCPKNGICYFPDGSYCDIKAFYNGTCPGKGYYDELMWQAEAYRFLNGDEGYYPSSSQAGQWPMGYYYGYYPYYYNGLYPGYYHMPIGYGSYRSDPLSPYTASA